MFVNHLVAMRASDALREGRVRQREVRKAPHPVGAVRLFEGRSDDGEKCRGEKKNAVKTHTGMEGFLESTLMKRTMCHPILMVFFPFPPPPPFSVFLQSCWAPPRDSTSTTKTQTGKRERAYVLVCVSACEISKKLSQKNAVEESLRLD